MNKGWIKLHRQILENPVTNKPDWAWLWICILLLANHEDREVIWNGEKRLIKKGQFITSREKLALVSHLHQSSVERALKYFKIEQQIEQQTNKRFRLITILKYNDYQDTEPVIEHQMNIKRTSNEHQMNTNKNVKNYKNEEELEEGRGETSSPTPRETMQDFIRMVTDKDSIYDQFVAKVVIQRNLTGNIVQAELDKFVNYWCEKNKTGTKERWEMEKVFEVQRRLGTWFGNMKNSNRGRATGGAFIS